MKRRSPFRWWVNQVMAWHKCVAVIVALLSLGNLAVVESSSPSWDNWQFLVGTWEAAGQGSPGQGAGTFSFTFDLQNKVLVRKSHTEYPGAAGRPAFSHDDLMVIYPDEAGKGYRATYFDSEGHVINYAAELSASGQTITFVSAVLPSQPRFRLTYVKKKEDILEIKFEIAPPGAPENFKVYVEGSARKK